MTEDEMVELHSHTCGPELRTFLELSLSVGLPLFQHSTLQLPATSATLKSDLHFLHFTRLPASFWVPLPRKGWPGNFLQAGS